MSLSFIVTLAGFALLFVGQRMFGGDPMLEQVFSWSGRVAVLLSLVLRVKAQQSARGEGVLEAQKKALVFLGVAIASVLVYELSTDSAVEMLGLGEEAAKRWSVCFTALWPILFLAGMGPLLLIDLAINDSPLAVQPLRVKQAIDNGLIAALGLALVFPVNYLASQHNERWDLAYFKTTEVGSSTQALVTNLTEPIVVRVFLPTSSDVRSELMPYFEDLAAANPDMMSVEVLDHAAVPVLAKELKIRDNGYIAITTKDGTEDAVTKSWKVGDELDKAKRNLKKLDQEFQKRLLDLAKGERVAYFTVGHGELNWKGGDVPDDKITNLKKVLQTLNFKVKELGLAQGLGDEIPDDATVVYVLGAQEDFLPAEIDALKRYVDRGGAVVVGLEPLVGEDTGPAGMADFLAHVGIAQGQGMLVSDSQFLRRTGDTQDRMNVVTNRYSSHESTTTLSKYSRQLHLVTPGSGWLEEVDGARGKVTVTVRSDDTVWADLNGDLKLDGDSEKKQVRPIAMAASGPAVGVESEAGSGPEPLEYRVTVVGDATMFSDLVLGNKANLQFVYDGTNWVIGEEDLAGTVENEEDVKIEHTQEDQKVWFYGTVGGIPLLVLVLGAIRVSRRRKSSVIRGGAA